MGRSVENDTHTGKQAHQPGFPQGDADWSLHISAWIPSFCQIFCSSQEVKWKRGLTPNLCGAHASPGSHYLSASFSSASNGPKWEMRFFILYRFLFWTILLLTEFLLFHEIFSSIISAPLFFSLAIPVELEWMLGDLLRAISQRFCWALRVDLQWTKWSVALMWSQIHQTHHQSTAWVRCFDCALAWLGQGRDLTGDPPLVPLAYLSKQQ